MKRAETLVSQAHLLILLDVFEDEAFFVNEPALF